MVVMYRKKKNKTNFSINVKEICLCCELLRCAGKVTSFHLRGVNSKFFDNKMTDCKV